MNEVEAQIHKEKSQEGFPKVICSTPMY